MDTIVYAARLKNNIDLEKSSSGGVYTALSNVFLKNGGAVACSLYDYKEKKYSDNETAGEQDRM